MKRGNWIAGMLLIMLAVSVWFGSAGFPPESSFFPRVISVVIIVLTAIMLIETKAVKDETVFEWAAANYPRTGKVFVLTAFYSFLLGYFGFIFLTPIALLAIMLVMEKGNYGTKIIASVLTTASIYLVFEVLLDVPLPAWSF